MSNRAVAVLDRFPLHLAAADPGKRFGAVVTALVADLDVLTTQMQGVRAARRIDEAPTVPDLLAIVALHGFGAAALTPLAHREAALRAAAGADPVDAAAISRLTGVPADVLTPLGDGLAPMLAAALRHRSRLEVQRGALRTVVAAQCAGNATPAALLRAAAGYLGLRFLGVRHVAGGWWHLATVVELLRLAAPQPGGPGPAPQPDVLALEENPVRRADIAPAPKRHGQRTRILRGGLEDVAVTVRVTGLADRTVRPMVVHLESGRGLVYEGNVPDGAELAFGSSGRVTLGGAEVTGSCWEFRGAVFADNANSLAGVDFSYTDSAGDVPATVAGAGPAATFAVAAPVPGAFDESPPLPHGGAAVGPLQLPRGQSRWVALVREAQTGSVAGVPGTPRTQAGRFDASVFAATTAAEVQPAMLLGFAWEEREPFAVRILLPQRFLDADDDAGTLLRQPLTRLLDRHRAAGVAVRLEYADPRWSLGDGVVRTNLDDALGVVLAGTQLWPDGTPQPEP
jgi:hypothetical protein